MVKKFVHKSLDNSSKCDWTIIGQDEEKIINKAEEHLLSCAKSSMYFELSNLSRATIRAVIEDDADEKRK